MELWGRWGEERDILVDGGGSAIPSRPIPGKTRRPLAGCQMALSFSCFIFPLTSAVTHTSPMYNILVSNYTPDILKIYIDLLGAEETRFDTPHHAAGDCASFCVCGLLVSRQLRIE
jgi:hypothetical protein